MQKFDWKNDLEFWSAKRAESVKVGAYQLVAFDLSPHSPEIGWELFTGPKLRDLVATGHAETFEAAQKMAEVAYLEKATATA